MDDRERRERESSRSHIEDGGRKVSGGRRRSGRRRRRDVEERIRGSITSDGCMFGREENV